jgi:nucleobase:cation symporter-1, NCS1 family
MGQVVILVRGIESIRRVEQAAAPLLVLLSGGLLYWAVSTAGGWGPLLLQPSQFGPGRPLHGQFWPLFIRTVTANVGGPPAPCRFGVFDIVTRGVLFLVGKNLA